MWPIDKLKEHILALLKLYILENQRDYSNVSRYVH